MALVRRIGFTRFSRFGVNLDRLHVTSATHSEALDGTDEIKVACSDDVNKGDYIVWADAQGKSHEHIVDDVSRTHGEDGTLETAFTAVNSIAELWDDWTDDKRPTGQVATALASVLAGTRWTVGTCDVTASASAVLYHQSVRESVAEILEKWGGELETQIITDGYEVTARKVGVRKTRGNQSSPKRFTWTKDVKSITRAVSSDNPKTRVYGYGKGVETDSGAYGRRLTFEEINGNKAYVEDTAATKIWGHPGTGSTILPACTSYVNEQCEDAAQLLAETKAYLTEVSQPKVSYTASVVDLYAFGRSWEGVGIGDKVAIIDKGFSEAGVRLTGRVSQIERDLLTGDASVTFGNLTDSMADMWQSVSQSLKASSRAAATYDAVAGTSVGWLTRLQNALNDQFNAVGTYKVETFELGTIYSNVSLNPATGLPLRTTSSMWAVNISGRGIRLASSLTSSGQWSWQTFITGKSVTADCINAGTMRADRVRAGLLTDELGRNVWDLTNGLLETNYMTARNIDASGSFQCGTSEDSLLMAGGALYGYENGASLGQIDFSAHSYNTADPSIKYKGLQLVGDGTIRITSPQIAVAASNDVADIADITQTATIEQPVVTEVHDAGNGTVGWHYGTFKLVVKNGMVVGYTTYGTS